MYVCNVWSLPEKEWNCFIVASGVNWLPESRLCHRITPARPHRLVEGQRFFLPIFPHWKNIILHQTTILVCRIRQGVGVQIKMLEKTTRARFLLGPAEEAEVEKRLRQSDKERRSSSTRCILVDHLRLWSTDICNSTENHCVVWCSPSFSIIGKRTFFDSHHPCAQVPERSCWKITSRECPIRL